MYETPMKKPEGYARYTSPMTGVEINTLDQTFHPTGLASVVEILDDGRVALMLRTFPKQDVVRVIMSPDDAKYLDSHLFDAGKTLDKSGMACACTGCVSGQSKAAAPDEPAGIVRKVWLTQDEIDVVFAARVARLREAEAALNASENAYDERRTNIAKEQVRLLGQVASRDIVACLDADCRQGCDLGLM
jgi:hypothetical protein